MGPIVCCVDDSEGARTALLVARRLAAALSHELLLVHVAEHTTAPGVSAVPGGRERLREQERSAGEALLERLTREEDVGEDVRRLVLLGPAAERLVETCGQEGAELVVIGSRGRSGVKAALLGSVSGAVAARAPCPCLVVPPGAAGRAFLEG